MTLSKLLIGLVGTVLLAFAAWTYAYPAATARYRLTIDVETPQGVRTGSGVIEVQYALQPPLLGSYHITSGTRGEAVAVDLGSESGTLFALLKESAIGLHRGPPELFVETFAPSLGSFDRDAIATITRLAGSSLVKELPPAQIPMLVRFRDRNDPLTVEKVDPGTLAKSFGPGVNLRRVTLQITRDPVTTGIERLLPWLPGLKGNYLHGGPTSRGAPLELHGGDFKTGWGWL
jgi:hypothetical protein